MKYTSVIEIPEDQVTTETYEAMKAAKAAGKIGIEIGKLGGDILYFERGDLREAVTMLSAEIAEEQAAAVVGFGTNKLKPDPVQTRPATGRWCSQCEKFFEDPTAIPGTVSSFVCPECGYESHPTATIHEVLA